MASDGPNRDATQDMPGTAGANGISNVERELYGGRLRYDQSYVRHEGPLTRLGFRRMTGALPRMVVMVHAPPQGERPGHGSRRRLLHRGFGLGVLRVQAPGTSATGEEAALLGAASLRCGDGHIGAGVLA